MAQQENQRNIKRGFPLNNYHQRIAESAMDQLRRLDPEEREKARRSANTLKETYLIAQTIAQSIGDPQVQIDSIDDFRKNASLGVLYTSCGLFAQRVIDRLPQPLQKSVETFMPDVMGLKENVRNELSISVGDASIEDFIQESLDNPQIQTTRPLGHYFTLLVDLVRANNDPSVLENIVQQNQNKKLAPEQLRHTILSSGSLAAAMLGLHDLDSSILVGKDKRAAAQIEKEAGRLLYTTARLQGEILTALSDPQSPQFPSVKDSVQQYLLSQDFNTKDICISSLTRDNIGQTVILYRTAQEFIDRGEEVQLYQGIVDSIEEIAQHRNQNSDKIFIITKEHIVNLLDNKQEILSEDTPTLEEITQLSKNLSPPRSKEPFSIDPQVVKQSGLSVPANIRMENRQQNNLLISFWYASEDGKPMELAVQFPVGKKNPDPKEFRWNVLPDPSKEPQLYRAVMRATKAVINNSKGQTEKRKTRQGPIVTTPQIPSGTPIQRQEPRRQTPPQRAQEKSTPISKDQVTITRAMGRTLRALPDDEHNKIQETIQTYNTSGGGNLRRLQLFGVRGGPYYGLDTEGDKIIVVQRVGKSSNLEVVAVGTLREVIRSLEK